MAFPCSLLFNFFVLFILKDVSAEEIVFPSIQPSKIWHSYMFDTGVGNREELHLSEVGVTSNFQLDENVWKWNVLQIHEQAIIIGLGDEFIFVRGFHERNSSHFSYKKAVGGKPKDITTFQRMNTTTQEVEGFVIVTTYTSQNEHFLKWFQFKNESLKYLWDWPVHGNITNLEVMKDDEELKLLLINHAIEGSKNPFAYIYSLVSDNGDHMIDSSLRLEDVPSSVVISRTSNSVYLAVAYTTLNEVHVFKYTTFFRGQKHFQPYQVIPSKGVNSISTFRMGVESYLAIASYSSTVYCFKDNTLLTPVIKSDFGHLKYWFGIHVKTYREDVILLAEDSEDILIVTWKGDKELQIAGNLSSLHCDSCLKNSNQLSLKGAASFFQNDHYVILPSKVGAPILLKLSAELRQLMNPVKNRMSDLLKIKSALEKQWDNQKQLLQKFVNKTSFPSSNQKLGKEYFISKLSTRNLELSGQSEVTKFELAQNKFWSDVDFSVDLKILKLNSSIISQKVHRIRKKLKENEGTSANEEEYTSLPNYFTGGLNVSGNVVVNHLELNKLNGYNVSEMLNDSFRLNHGGAINGTKTAKNVVVNNVSFEKLGNILACDLVFSDDLWEGNNSINGNIVYENDLLIKGHFDLQSGGLTNNMNLKRDIFYINSSYDKPLVFENLKITERTYVEKRMNKQDLILPVRNSPLNIHSLDNLKQARVEKIKVDRLNITFLNNLIFQKLVEQLKLQNTTNSLSQVMDNNDVYKAHNLTINYLNGLEFPKDFILATQKEPVVITGEKKFQGHLVVDGVNSKESVKEIKTSPRVQVFENVKVDGAILVNNSVNNYFWDFFGDVLKKNAKGGLIFGKKEFPEIVSPPNLELLGKLNNNSVKNILNDDSNQIISNKFLIKNVVFQNLTINGTWDGVCVECLNKTVIRLSGNDINEASLHFGSTSEIKSDRLKVLSSINKQINSGNIYSNNEDVYLNADVNFSKIRSSKVVVNGYLTIADTVPTNFESNENDLMMNETHKYSRNEESKKKAFMNQKSYLAKFDDAKEKAKTQFLEGKISRIRKLFVKGNIRTEDNVNKMNLTEIKKLAIDILKPVNFSKDITFEDKVTFHKLNISGLIDGVDLKRLHKDVVYKRSNVLIRGLKNFLNGIKVKNLNVRKLNGQLLKNILSKHGDHIIKGALVINGNVFVKGNLNCDGLINGAFVRGLHQKFSSIHSAYIVPHDLELSSTSIKVDNLVVGGLISNISFDSFLADTISIEDDFATEGNKILLENITFAKNLEVNGLFNNLNFSQFITDIVSVDRPAKVKGNITISKTIMKNLIVKRKFTSRLIHGCDTNEWMEESIPLYGNTFIKGNKTFTDAQASKRIFVDSINDYSFDNMIPLRTAQNVPGSVHFSQIHSTSDVTVNGMVNNKVLISEFTDTVSIAGNQTISGKIVFDEDVTLDGNVIVHSINDRDIRNLTTLHTDQVIDSVLTFNGTIIANQDILDVEEVNEIDILKWNNDSLSLDKFQNIGGNWIIKGNTTALKNVIGHASLDSIDLPYFSEKLREKKSLASKVQKEIKADYESKCQDFRNISKTFSREPYLLQQLETTYSMEVNSSVQSLITFQAGGNYYFIITFFGDCRSLLHRWDKEEAKFYSVTNVKLGPVKKWMTLIYNNVTYLITSSTSSDNIKCEENQKPGNLWSFKDDKLGHVASTDAFADVIQDYENPNKFFTLGSDGSLYEWILSTESKFLKKQLLNIKGDNFRFLDHRIVEGLALTNGNEIRKIDLTKDPVEFTTLVNGNLPGLRDGEITVTTIEGKLLTAVTFKDQIVVYDNPLQPNEFSLLHANKPQSMLWIHYGQGKEVFLVFESMHKRIEVFQYKGLSGFKKIISYPIRSTRLQLMSLPVKGSRPIQNYVAVIQNKRIELLAVQMLGNLIDENYISC